MVLKIENSFLNKKNKFLKFFFFLRKSKKWSGGRSFGKKIFWGQVGIVSGWWFIYWINRNFSIINIKGLIQSFFKPFNINFIVSLVFFWKYGLLSFLPTADLTNISDEIITNITPTEISSGASNLLKNFSVGSIIFSLQLQLNNSAKISWSSGTSCKVLKHLEGKAFVQFPSSTVGILPLKCFAIKGSSYWIPLKKLKKAGNSRIIGKIPKVWGIAMNPVDHPHGGRTNGGIHPWTPTGFLTKNVKTRKKKKWSNSLIFSWKN